MAVRSTGSHVLISRRAALGSLLVPAFGLRAQEIPFICPMDPDVRSATPAKCPRCGMALVAGIPDAREFQLRLTLEPKAPRPGHPVRMVLRPIDPKTGRAAKLQLIHEKLLHLFLVSSDLSYFAHEHPELQPDGSFVYKATFPRSGEYRVLCDFYPENAMPQLIANTVWIPGAAQPSAALQADIRPQRGGNMTVSLRMEPEMPLAGLKTMLFFHLNPADSLEPYLGAWGHMLCASADLIDLIHTHPAWADLARDDKSDAIQFNVIFPRPGLHRIWVQFQRAGVVNTVAFTIPVGAV